MYFNVKSQSCPACQCRESPGHDSRLSSHSKLKVGCPTISWFLTGSATTSGLKPPPPIWCPELADNQLIICRIGPYQGLNLPWCYPDSAKNQQATGWQGPQWGSSPSAIPIPPMISWLLAGNDCTGARLRPGSVLILWKISWSSATRGLRVITYWTVIIFA